MNTGRKMRWLGVIGAIWLLGADALAQGAPRPPMRDHGGPGLQQQGRQMQAPGGQGMQRMMPDTRPTQFVPDDDRPHRHRMTPEERRQLRQDVHQAGQELYPLRMRERRRDLRREE